jgi:hypothetical protein
MGKHRRPCDDAPPQAVISGTAGGETAGKASGVAGGQAGAAYWSVHDAGWPALRPNLPAELIDLLAPPIVVGVARGPSAARLGTAPARPAPPPAPPRPAPPPGPARPAPPVPAPPAPARPAPAEMPFNWWTRRGVRCGA